jgi:hypothetical protein
MVRGNSFPFETERLILHPILPSDCEALHVL